MLPEVVRVLKLARSEARKGSGAAKRYRDFVLVAVAILVVSVGTVSAVARWSRDLSRQNGTPCQTTKYVRMAEAGAADIAPAKQDLSESPTLVFIPYFVSRLHIEVVRLPELPTLTAWHGLRAPPLA
jgi:hypothetical protein